MSENRDPKKRAEDDRKMKAYLKMFIGPTFILKALLLYFGLNYSEFPGEGYGYGLAAVIVLSLFNAGIFIWKNYDDEEMG